MLCDSIFIDSNFPRRLTVTLLVTLLKNAFLVCLHTCGISIRPHQLNVLCTPTPLMSVCTLSTIKCCWMTCISAPIKKSILDEIIPDFLSYKTCKSESAVQNPTSSMFLTLCHQQQHNQSLDVLILQKSTSATSLGSHHVSTKEHVKMMVFDSSVSVRVDSLDFSVNLVSRLDRSNNLLNYFICYIDR